MRVAGGGSRWLMVVLPVERLSLYTLCEGWVISGCVGSEEFFFM